MLVCATLKMKRVYTIFHKICTRLVNSSRLSEASIMIYVSANKAIIGSDNGLSPVFSAKPFSEPMIVYCQLHLEENTSASFETTYNNINWRKCIWKCHQLKWMSRKNQRNHNKTQQSANHAHYSWDVLYKNMINVPTTQFVYSNEWPDVPSRNVIVA